MVNVIKIISIQVVQELLTTATTTVDSGEGPSVDESTESEVMPQLRSVSIQASISPALGNAQTLCILYRLY